MASSEPKRLGDLIAAGAWLRVDCNTCGRWALLRPKKIADRSGPSYPWRWLQFRCRCKSRDTTVRIGTPEKLRQLPPPDAVPLYARQDVIAAVTHAIVTRVPDMKDMEALALAVAVLRQLDDLGVQ